MYPRSWNVGGAATTVGADDALCRVWDALDKSEWIRIEGIVNPLIDALVDAGYAEQWGHSDSGCFWAITPAGHARLCALGRDAAEGPN